MFILNLMLGQGKQKTETCGILLYLLVSYSCKLNIFFFAQVIWSKVRNNLRGTESFVAPVVYQFLEYLLVTFTRAPVHFLKYK